MPSTNLPSLAQLQRALAIAEQIQQLEEELATVMGDGASRRDERPAVQASSSVAGAPAKRGRKPFSAETKARMAAAQRARWAGKSGAGAGAAVSPSAKRAKAGKRNVSPEVRARLAAAMKARWAAARKKGLPGPNARK